MFEDANKIYYLKDKAENKKYVDFSDFNVDDKKTLTSWKRKKAK